MSIPYNTLKVFVGAEDLDVAQVEKSLGFEAGDRGVRIVRHYTWTMRCPIALFYFSIKAPDFIAVSLFVVLQSLLFFLSPSSQQF